MTKEDVIARAKELGLTLTDSEVEQHVKDGKLPEKPTDKRDDLRNAGVEKLIDMVLTLRSENAERRIENKSLKEQAEALTKQINEVGDLKTKYPELEKSLTALKDSERKRRETLLAKIDEKKRASLIYLGDVDKVSGDQFDATVDLLIETKSSGQSGVPRGASEPPEPQVSEEDKREAARMGLAIKDYLEVKETRNKNKK